MELAMMGKRENIASPAPSAPLEDYIEHRNAKNESLADL